MNDGELYIAATGTWLPPVESVAEAVADGRCDPAVARAAQVESVTVSRSEPAPEMAARAGRTALARAGAGPGDIDLLLHASFFYQGFDLWAPASYIQRVTLGNQCPAMEVRQVSNGGMAALDLAWAYLHADSGRSAALITTGDRFCEPRFDRWRSDPGTVYGDGGTALVVSRHDGFARVRSLASVSAPDLEGMHRGDDPFGTGPFGHRTVVDLEAHKQDFLARNDLSPTVARVAAAQEGVIKQALADAGSTLEDIDWFVLPHLGRRRLQVTYFARFGIDPARSTWQWSRGIGHLGAGDPFAGLDHLATTGALTPGDTCLLVSVGAGFSWSCAVVDVRQQPTWRAVPAA
ncbi:MULTISPECIES: ketoacyl-ACP synthase III family protein [Streptomyces]|uniref:Ketoacyl-ACP synthase III n=1 Tax=Streptomyces luteosporeus TaxID=173856 RepID=A0ABP6G9B8_9ACTN